MRPGWLDGDGDDDGPVDDDWIHAAYYDRHPLPPPPDTLVTMNGR